MAEDLQRLKDIRSAYRGHCTRNMEAARVIMEAPIPDINKLKDLLKTVIARKDKLALIDSKVENMVDAKDIEAEVQDAEEDLCGGKTFKKLKDEVKRGEK